MKKGLYPFEQLLTNKIPIKVRKTDRLTIHGFGNDLTQVLGRPGRGQVDLPMLLHTSPDLRNDFVSDMRHLCKVRMCVQCCQVPRRSGQGRSIGSTVNKADIFHGFVGPAVGNHCPETTPGCHQANSWALYRLNRTLTICGSFLMAFCMRLSKDLISRLYYNIRDLISSRPFLKRL
jgi:hypothetical protein